LFGWDDALSRVGRNMARVLATIRADDDISGEAGSFVGKRT
jgi:hypothetical protein